MRTEVLCRLVALCVLLLAYGNALQGSFQFDDFNVIVNNPDVQSLSVWRDAMTSGIRPLLKLSYTLNALWGDAPAGYITVNLLIHGCCAALAWSLMQRLLMVWQTEEHGLEEPARWLAFGGTVIFLVHPVHTEAVTYISGRSSSLMTLCYLAGLWVYTKPQQLPPEPNAGPGIWRLAMVVFWFLMALCAKEIAVTFPAALLLWDLMLSRSVREAWRRQWPVWAVFGMAALAFVSSATYNAHMQNSVNFNSLTGNIATQAVAWAYLCRQWVLPIWLNIDPDLRAQSSVFEVTVPLIFMVLCLAGGVFFWRRRPWLAFGIGWAWLHLVPLYWFLPRIDVANERQWYLASWPLCLALAVEFHRFMGQQVGRASLGALVCICAGLTHIRNQDYASEIALWQATVVLSPQKARVHNNLGYAFQLAGRTIEARAAYLRALALDPGHIQAHFNLRALSEKPSP